MICFHFLDGRYGCSSTAEATNCTPLGVDLNRSPRTDTFSPVCTAPVGLANPVKVVTVPVVTVMLAGHTVPLVGWSVNVFVPTLATVPSTVPSFKITWSAIAGFVPG